MELSAFFQENPNCAIAFSGGVDSAYLLYAAVTYGANVTAYFVKSAFQPQFELDDAVRFAGELQVRLRVLSTDLLSIKEITANTNKRCYFCKKLILSTIQKAARKDGFFLLLDGSNASDDETDRPGMQAVKELFVRSPLRECGLTKNDIRLLSKEAGLFTCHKPAYACLATRIPFGTPITSEKLTHTELAEDYLRSLGFFDFRVRCYGNAARIQVAKDQLYDILTYRERIREELLKYYSDVFLDLNVR